MSRKGKKKKTMEKHTNMLCHKLLKDSYPLMELMELNIISKNLSHIWLWVSNPYIDGKCSLLRIDKCLLCFFIEDEVNGDYTR